MDNTMISMQNISQIKWACRRGMLELDILLTQYVTAQYEQLSPVSKVIFIELLSSPDPTLLAWLLGQEKPERADFAIMVENIRHYAQSKF